MTLPMKDVSVAAIQLSNRLHEGSMASKYAPRGLSVDFSLDRWERLLGNDDDERIWKANSWRGELAGSQDGGSGYEGPSDDEFKGMFERILSPPNVS